MNKPFCFVLLTKLPFSHTRHVLVCAKPASLKPSAFKIQRSCLQRYISVFLLSRSIKRSWISQEDQPICLASFVLLCLLSMWSST